MSNQDLETVEREYSVQMNDALERLEKNPDFKLVILEGYFKNKAVNQVSLLAMEHIKKQGQRPDIMEELVAISQLQDYFFTIKSMGQVANNDIQEIEGE